MTIYVAGKITGLSKEESDKKFKEAATMLQEQGHRVFIPTVLPAYDEVSHDDYLHICFAMIDICKCVYMLKNWRQSEGAKLELLYATTKGKVILYEDESTLEMTSTDVDNLEFENKKLKQFVEDNKQGYRSVKDALPPSDGLFYDVIGILWNDNICGGYNYHRGQYQNGFFFFDHSMYLQKEDFRNSNTQKKVIAWMPLLKCTSGLITKFRKKQGVL